VDVEGGSRASHLDESMATQHTLEMDDLVNLLLWDDFLLFENI